MRLIVRYCFIALAAVTVLALMPTFASADSLTGAVSVTWLFPDNSTPIISGPDAVGTTISCTGTSTPACSPLAIIPGSEISFEADGSSITYTGTGFGSADYLSGTTSGGTPITFNGFEFSDLTFTSSGTLAGYALTTNISGLTASDITFGSDFIEVNMAGLPGEGYFTLNLISTPEPGTLGLLALGLAGVLALAWGRRRLVLVA
jgi:PEP-CTERM motif